MEGDDDDGDGHGDDGHDVHEPMIESSSGCCLDFVAGYFDEAFHYFRIRQNDDVRQHPPDDGDDC